MQDSNPTARTAISQPAEEQLSIFLTVAFIGMFLLIGSLAMGSLVYHLAGGDVPSLFLGAPYVGAFIALAGLAGELGSLFVRRSR